MWSVHHLLVWVYLGIPAVCHMQPVQADNFRSERKVNNRNNAKLHYIESVATLNRSCEYIDELFIYYGGINCHTSSN